MASSRKRTAPRPTAWWRQLTWLAKTVRHPPTTYVRDSHIVPELDACLGRLFGAENIEAAPALLRLVSEGRLTP